MKQNSVNLVDVKRFAVHDGPGIRTTFFLKGCPLHCIWCHNPEGISGSPQIAFYSHKCINCGECVTVCPTQAHVIVREVHEFDRIKCITCGRCETACLAGALRLYGKETGMEEILSIAREDRAFFRQSGGGVTFSGGEPLLQADFCASAAKKLMEDKITTAIDTCGYVPFGEFEKVIPYTEIFLYDIKHIDPAIHKQLTGQSNELILENLRKLSDTHARIEVRMPLVPGCNDNRKALEQIASFLNKCRIEKIRVLPYHSMAWPKYQALGIMNTLPNVEPPNNTQLEEVVYLMRRIGVNAVSELD